MARAWRWRQRRWRVGVMAVGSSAGYPVLGAAFSGPSCFRLSMSEPAGQGCKQVQLDQVRWAIAWFSWPLTGDDGQPLYKWHQVILAKGAVPVLALHYGVQLIVNKRRLPAHVAEKGAEPVPLGNDARQ
jgi:hypothetical protein